MACYCCERGSPTNGPRECPACGHVFQGVGWGGIDAHWRSKHESIMTFEAFMERRCEAHRAVGDRWSRR